MMIPVALLMVAAQAVSGALVEITGHAGAAGRRLFVWTGWKTAGCRLRNNTLRPNHFHIAGRMIGGGNRPVPDRATMPGEFLGKVERIDDEAAVRADWQRIRKCRSATAPGGSIQLTLIPATVPLDSGYAGSDRWLRRQNGELSRPGSSLDLGGWSDQPTTD